MKTVPQVGLFGHLFSTKTLRTDFDLTWSYKMSTIEKLLNTEHPFLADGGFETWLFYQQGFNAPEFAAITLMDDPEAKSAMRRYFDGFLNMAAEADTGFVLDTNTWRGCLKWGPALGLSSDQMLRLNSIAVEFAQDICQAWRDKVSTIIVNGVVGPAGDGYRPEDIPDPETALHTHLPQIRAFARSGVDMVSAITMTNIGEAVGITQAAQQESLPAVISFTVETDGRLPTGETLGDAIGQVDAMTDQAPIYYMVNCAHPDHFSDAIAKGAHWVERIGGLRANASRLSHAELDAAEELDDGNPHEFGHLHAGLAERLPNLRVVGGCCGTDHRHVGHVSDHLHAKHAA